MKRILRKIYCFILYQAYYRKNLLARITDLDQRLAALESSKGSKPKAMSVKMGAQ